MTADQEVARSSLQKLTDDIHPMLIKIASWVEDEKARTPKPAKRRALEGLRPFDSPLKFEIHEREHIPAILVGWGSFHGSYGAYQICSFTYVDTEWDEHLRYSIVPFTSGGQSNGLALLSYDEALDFMKSALIRELCKFPECIDAVGLESENTFEFYLDRYDTDWGY